MMLKVEVVELIKKTVDRKRAHHSWESKSYCTMNPHCLLECTQNLPLNRNSVVLSELWIRVIGEY